MRKLAYYRTLLRSRRRRPKGAVYEEPYARCIELALRALASPYGYGVKFPEAQRYTMLEFGVARGASFVRMLYHRDVWARRLRVGAQVTALGFDTFAGLPEPREGDEGLAYRAGDFPSEEATVRRILERQGYRDFELVSGLFSETLPGLRERLKAEPPLFVSIDCDYYSSTVDAFREILPLAPHGVLFYFDDVAVNFWSSKTGEMRAIAELNEGRWGDHLELVEYPLWIQTGEIRHYRQIYRLMNLEGAERQSEEIAARPVEVAPEPR